MRNKLEALDKTERKTMVSQALWEGYEFISTFLLWRDSVLWQHDNDVKEPRSTFFSKTAATSIGQYQIVYFNLVWIHGRAHAYAPLKEIIHISFHHSSMELTEAKWAQMRAIKKHDRGYGWRINITATLTGGGDQYLQIGIRWNPYEVHT